MTSIPSDDPTDDALAALLKLATAGVPPDRIVQTIGSMIAAWAEEADMTPAAAQLRIERLWDVLGKDTDDLQASISDAEGEGPALTAANRSLAALQAAVAALAAAHARL
jgi:hypothetical protein